MTVNQEITFTLCHKENLFIVKYNDGIRLGEDSDEFSETGLLYGRLKRSKYFLLSGAAGLSYTKRKWTYDESDKKNKHSYIGIPVEAACIITPASFFGIGLKAFTTLRSSSQGLGAVLTLCFGNMPIK